MKKFLLRCLISAVSALLFIPTAAGRSFDHPCVSCTRADLDRMRSMVEAKAEPYYSAFIELRNSKYSALTQKPSDRGTQIREGKFNGTVGRDGRAAHDLALLWHITGNTAYADKAVEFLNANSHYNNTSCRGTGPLDNGKIYLLIAAAELMRDYEGWKEADRERFNTMLVYPGYSTVKAPQGNLNDDLNGITFYWNIYNFDAMRFGNQGLFAARALMAMGIYLDNELMYDRAYNYLMCLPRNPADEIPYHAGPPVWTRRIIEASSSDYKTDYTVPSQFGDSEYYYDEALQYYIYANGQTQETSRDQAHSVVGLNMLCDLAEMAWNAGDDMYGALDNRLLTGYEFLGRYNLSDWEPTGFTTDESKVSFDNGMYLQRLCRSTRWESLRPSPDGRGDPAGNGGSREQALAHYAVRAGLDPAEYRWLEKYRDYMIEHFGCERSGNEPNWYYEFCGWGTLTKRRTAQMAGDPVSRTAGVMTRGQHNLPGTVEAADYDYYSPTASPEGHTYHNTGSVKGNAYRADGTVEIALCDGRWAVTDNHSGEWFNYTVGVPKTDLYDVAVTYRSKGSGELSVAVDGGTKTTAAVVPTDGNWATAILPRISFAAGSAVMRLGIEREADGLEIASMDIRPSSEMSGVLALNGHEDNIEISGQHIRTTGSSAVLTVHDTAGRLVAQGDSRVSVPSPGNYIISVRRDGRSSSFKRKIEF